MVKIRFKYRDEFCKDGKWNEQECIVSSLAECIKFMASTNANTKF